MQHKPSLIMLIMMLQRKLLVYCVGETRRHLYHRWPAYRSSSLVYCLFQLCSNNVRLLPPGFCRRRIAWKCFRYINLLRIMKDNDSTYFLTYLSLIDTLSTFINLSLKVCCLQFKTIFNILQFVMTVKQEQSTQQETNLCISTMSTPLSTVTKNSDTMHSQHFIV